MCWVVSTLTMDLRTVSKCLRPLIDYLCYFPIQFTVKINIIDNNPLFLSIIETGYKIGG